MRIIRSGAVHEGTMFFLTGLKQVNQRLYHQIRHEMFFHNDYRDAVHALSLFVPGTKIPCGAALVTVPEAPKDFVEFLGIFARTVVAARNGVLVGAIMSPSSYTDFGAWSVSPNVNVSGVRPQHYLLVSICFDTQDFLQNLPETTHTTTNLASVPDIARAVMGFPTITSDTLRVVGTCGVTAIYARLIRAYDNTSMKAIFEAIAYVEGWNMHDFEMSVGGKTNVLWPQCTVTELIEFANNINVPASPQIVWPYLPPFHQLASSSDSSSLSSQNEAGLSDAEGDSDNNEAGAPMQHPYS